MGFTFLKTEINGLLIIEPHVFWDMRGIYRKNYEKYVFDEHGYNTVFTESSDIYSGKGVLRGLHYQTSDSQAKLIHVISGTLFDVALDLRQDSPTFGKYHTELLNGENSKGIFIPEGFAHGFISLTDKTIFSYQCSGKYTPEFCGGIRWDDPDLHICWPLREYGINKVIATEKDKTWPTWREYVKRMEANDK